MREQTVCMLSLKYSKMTFLWVKMKYFIHVLNPCIKNTLNTLFSQDVKYCMCDMCTLSVRYSKSDFLPHFSLLLIVYNNRWIYYYNDYYYFNEDWYINTSHKGAFVILDVYMICNVVKSIFIMF